MVDVVWGGLSAGFGLLALFGGLALLLWIDSRSKAKERELAHIERLKALELGQPLPDAEVARHQSEASRAWAAGVAALIVPLGLGGVAIGATSLVFGATDPRFHVPLLSIIWGVCGIVSLVTVSVGLGAIRQREKASHKACQSLAAADREPIEKPASGIQEVVTPAAANR